MFDRTIARHINHPGGGARARVITVERAVSLCVVCCVKCVVCCVLCVVCCVLCVVCCVLCVVFCEVNFRASM